MASSRPRSQIIRACEPITCCDEIWEAAYLRFESPEQEIRKFRNRLLALGAEQWPRSSRIVELFCGRGNGLHALEGMGFDDLTGVDLSERLLEQFAGNAMLYVADGRALPFADGSFDIVIVQGGLHHLSDIPGDLSSVLGESHRILRDEGRFIAVEPWLTPFLRLVHAACKITPLSHLWPRLNALATMIEREKVTYNNWLESNAAILHALDRVFASERRSIGWGKLSYVGRKR